MVFAGSLKEGRREGKGKVYSYGGHLLFDGQFSEDRYESMGIACYLDGTVNYGGNFAGGRYDGQGVFHDPLEEVTYEGGFAGGRYDGEGITHGEREKDALELLRAQMVPGLLEGRDRVGLCSPLDYRDITLGVWLHDLEENDQLRINGIICYDESIQYPSMYLSLHYMITVGTGGLSLQSGHFFYC